MGEVHLDIRSIPLPMRNPKIFAAFEALAPPRALTVVTDDEPRPLRTEFESRHPGSCWSERRLGHRCWEVRLGHPESSVGEAPTAAAISKSRLLAGLGESLLAEAAYRARRVAVKRNRIVVDEDVDWPYVGVVERGSVRATLATPLGHEYAVYELFPGDVFGEFAALDGGQTPLRFVGETKDCAVVLLPLEFLLPVMERHRDIGERLSTVSVQHTRALLSYFASLASQTTTARVAQVLLAYAASSGGGMHDALRPLASLTQSGLALRAGTVKEVVSRALAELEQCGALRRRGGHVVALDRDRLLVASKSVRRSG